jgi:hypothetical protein
VFNPAVDELDDMFRAISKKSLLGKHNTLHETAMAIATMTTTQKDVSILLVNKKVSKILL